MITRQDELDALCARLADQPVIGVDTEYLTDRRFWPELCLVQVAGGGEEALIDPLAELDLAPLGRLLDAGPVVVMHNAAADAPLLARATGAGLTRVFDTMIAAGFVGSGELSLGGVVQRFLDVTLAKGATLTDWSRRPLPEGALRYALEDVRYLGDLWRVLSGLLAERGRQQWADDETRRTLQRSMEPPDPTSAWKRLENSRRLRGASLAVAAEVTAWRLRTAMELNRPPKRVMGDLAVLAISESKPTTIEGLANQRGVDGGIVRSHGEEVVAAVARALAADPSTWPRKPSPPPPELASVHDALGLAARLVAHRVDVATWLAYERVDLGGLVEDPRRGRLTEGWRAEVLAPPLIELLEGRQVLTVERGRLELVPRQTG